MANKKTPTIESVYEDFSSLDQKDQVSAFKLIQQFLEDAKVAAKQSVELLGEVVKDGK